jgi:BlaI family penicillinase repressor
MEQKGYVDHEAKGRVFVFRPLVTQEEIDRLSVQALLEQNFGGSAQSLFVNLLQSENLKASDIDAMEALIHQFKESRR